MPTFFKKLRPGDEVCGEYRQLNEADAWDFVLTHDNTSMLLRVRLTGNQEPDLTYIEFFLNSLNDALALGGVRLCLKKVEASRPKGDGFVPDEETGALVRPTFAELRVLWNKRDEWPFWDKLLFVFEEIPDEN